MRHAEALGILSDEQYGSRKGKSAIEQALHTRLTFDYWRQRQVSGLLCSNDAKACYDRIVHSVAALAMRRLGVPKAATLLMLGTVHSLRHHV